jgi:predicted DNA repair protein MutK
MAGSSLLALIDDIATIIRRCCANDQSGRQKNIGRVG